MSFEPQVLTAAQAELESRKITHRQSLDRIQQNIYERDPYIKKIDQELVLSMSALIQATLSRKDASVLHEIKEKNQALQREKKDRLHALQVDPRAVTTTYLCEKCGDSGWDGRKMCSCLHNICVQKQLAQLSSLSFVKNQDFSQFSLDYYNDQPPANQKVSDRARMERVLHSCQQYASRFHDFPSKHLLFIGETGLGKTFLTACIAKQVAENGYSVVYEPAKPLFYQFDVRNFSKGTEEDIDKARICTKRYFQCDLLIIDDLGTEITNKATDSVLYELVNERILGGKHTIFTTNFPIEELEQRYSNPIMSRLKGEFVKVHFYGEDIRQQKKIQG